MWSLVVLKFPFWSSATDTGVFWPDIHPPLWSDLLKDASPTFVAGGWHTCVLHGNWYLLKDSGRRQSHLITFIIWRLPIALDLGWKSNMMHWVYKETPRGVKVKALSQLFYWIVSPTWVKQGTLFHCPLVDGSELKFLGRGRRMGLGRQAWRSRDPRVFCTVSRQMGGNPVGLIHSAFFSFLALPNWNCRNQTHIWCYFPLRQQALPTFAQASHRGHFGCGVHTGTCIFPQPFGFPPGCVLKWPLSVTFSHLRSPFLVFATMISAGSILFL